MLRVMFVCHGNICRSPMAEFVMKDIVCKSGLESEIFIESAATSTEETGNDIHYGTRQILIQKGIPFRRRAARQITSADYQKYDYLIGMDDENIFNMKRRWNNDPENKVFLLLEFAGKTRGIADPWYTGNFEETYSDIAEGCNGLMKYILKKNKIDDDSFLSRQKKATALCRSIFDNYSGCFLLQCIACPFNARN